MMKNLFKMTSLHLQKMGSGKGAAILLIACALLTTKLTSAAGYESTLTIKSWDNRPFVIEVNNERYKSNGTFTLSDMEPGKTRIRVIRRSSHNGHMNQGRGGRGVVLYNGIVDIPRNSRVNAKVDRNRNLRIIDIRRLGGNRPHNINRPSRPSGGQCGNGGYGQIEYESNDHNYGFTPYSYEHTSGYGGACAMDYAEFNSLLYDIDDACFSSEKLRVARQALRHNLITTIQLEELIRSMDFSSTELEVAKIGYDSLIDKENIWKVYDAFSFSSTARQFEEFVCQQ